MPIDPRIALGVQPMQIQQQDPNSRMNALARVMQVGGMMDEQKLNALKVDEYKRNLADQESLRNDLAAPGADPYNALLKRGRLKEANDFAQGQATTKKTETDQRKSELEMGLKKAEHAASLFTLAKDPQSYAVVRAMVKQQFGQDLPEQFDPNFVQGQIAMGQTITQKLAAEHQRMTLAETSRHNVTTEGETGRHNRNTEGIQVRGQNLVNQRAQEANTNGRIPAGYRLAANGQGLEFIPGGPADPGIVKDKALTEGQAKANLFGTRMQEADRVLAQMATQGVKRPGAIKGVAETLGNIAGLGTESMGGALSDAAGSLTNFTQSAEQQQVEQAQRDFINAALRRESGASISPAEFRNANKQYFPQPNDDEATLALKARNRQISTQGILAEVPENKRTKPAAAEPEGKWETEKERRYQEWKAKQGKK